MGLEYLNAGENPDFATQDLFDAIGNKTYPGWTLYAQILTPQQAEAFKYNVLDLTKYVVYAAKRWLTDRYG